MNLNKENLIKHIKKIRKEIGHEDSDIKIQKIIFNENSKELWIITPDRPDKSAIIGKGGWVVGRLKEETNLSKIHVESYSDFLLKEYQMKLSLESLSSFIEENTSNYISDQNSEENTFLRPIKNLKDLLEEKINNIYTFNLEEYFNKNNENNKNNKNNGNNGNNENNEINKNNDTNKNTKPQYKAIVALSGGVDSSFSLIIAKKLGFNPLAITIDPGTIVLPNQFKKNIDKLCNDLGVDHKYISVDYSEIIKDSINGRFHPCGPCSSIIESTLFNYAAVNDINIVIFGDMLSTGFQCITKHIIPIENDPNSNKENKEIYRLNLPATLSTGKEEIRNIVSKYNLEKIKGYGCPLLYETQKKYPHMKKFSIQRILRETRAGALEPGEALKLIWSFYRL